MLHFGLNVYCWTREQQNACLGEVVMPALGELAGRLPGLRLWANRNDCRGPHLMLLFSVPDDDSRPALEAELVARLEAFFARRRPSAPTGEALEMVEQRARAAREVVLCAPDREPGLAPEHSVAVFEQPADGYPFSLARDLRNPEAVWSTVDSLMRWAVAKAAALPDTPQPRSAARLLADLDRELATSGLHREGFWRYYVGSLLPRVKVRLDDDPDALFAELPTIVGDSNRETLSALWEETADEPPVWPDLPELVSLLDGEIPAPLVRRHRLLRHVVHWTQKLLGVRLPVEIPFLLFVWHRAWAAAEAEAGGVEVGECAP